MAAITLKIIGNKISNTGVGANLVYIGEAQFILLDNQYTGFRENSAFYTIASDEKQTIYTLVKNGVSSAGANREGTLKMAISIPLGYRIAGNVSPYKVLNELSDYYLAMYMTYSSVKGTYQFKEEKESEEPFRAILDKYPLESAPENRQVMKGTGTACVLADPSKIEKLFLDLRYPEFEEYGEIVVAEKGTPQYPILKIEIPRKIRYKVFNDSTYTGQQIADEFTSCTVLKKARNEYYDEGRIIFTLKDVRTGIHEGDITLDELSERVLCHVTDTPKEIPYYVVLEDATMQPGNVLDEEKDAFYLVRVNPLAYQPRLEKQVPLKGTLTLVGDENAGDWKLEYRGRKKYEISEFRMDVIHGRITATVTLPAPVEKSPSLKKVITPNTTVKLKEEQPIVREEEKRSLKEGIVLNISVDTNGYAEMDSLLKVRIQSKNHPDYLYEDTVSMGMKKTAVTLCLTELWSRESVEIQLFSERYTYSVRSVILRQTGENNVKFAIVGKNSAMKRMLTEYKNIGVVALVFLLVGVLLGIGASMGYNKLTKSNEKTEEASDSVVVEVQNQDASKAKKDTLLTEVSKDSVETKKDTSNTVNQSKRKYESYLKALNDESLKFKTIEEIQAWVISEEGKAYEDSIQSKKLSKKAQLYTDVVKAIKAWSISAIKEYAKNEELLSSHRECLQACYQYYDATKGTRPLEYTKIQKAAAKKYYDENKDSFNSFQSLNKIAGKVKETR